MRTWERFVRILGGNKLVLQSSLFKRTLEFYHKLGYENTRKETFELEPRVFFSVQNMEKIL
jgi:hypothetical protein